MVAVAFSIQMLPTDNSQCKDDSSLWVNPSITKGSMIKWKVMQSWPCAFISSSNFQLRETPASAHKACGDLFRASVSHTKESESTALLKNGIGQSLWVFWGISAPTYQPWTLHADFAFVSFIRFISCHATPDVHVSSLAALSGFPSKGWRTGLRPMRFPSTVAPVERHWNAVEGKPGEVNSHVFWRPTPDFNLRLLLDLKKELFSGIDCAKQSIELNEETQTVMACAPKVWSQRPISHLPVNTLACLHYLHQPYLKICVTGIDMLWNHEVRI